MNFNATNNRKKNVFSKTGLNKVKMWKGMLLCVLALLFISSLPGFAQSVTLCKPWDYSGTAEQFYNENSWTWTPYGPCTNSYNCLGYATGSMNWEWPWSGNATYFQVTTYLRTKGFYSSGYNPRIISYGHSSDSICHFSKVTSSSTCRAKWGGLNLTSHGSWDPYYSDSCYGSKRSVYYGTRYMRVTISGPTDLQYMGFYQWFANVSYGTPPYSYKWTYSSPAIFPTSMGTNSYAELVGIFEDNVTIEVEVTDATGRKAYADIYVTVIGSSSGGGTTIGGGGSTCVYCIPAREELESAVDKDLIEADVYSILDDATTKNIVSGNPYNYVDNEHFRRIVKLGPAALMPIRKMILASEENGLKEYILAIAAEEIARVNLKGDSFAWEDAKSWRREWDKYMRNLPAAVENIIASDQTTAHKNKALAKLGIPAIPFIIDEIARGKTEYNNVLKTLLKGSTVIKEKNDGESLESWRKKNVDVIRILKDINDVYNKKNKKRGAS